MPDIFSILGGLFAGKRKIKKKTNTNILKYGKI